MSKFKVVLTDNIFPDLIIEREMLDKVDAELVEVTDPATLADEVKDADAVINTYAQMTPEIINGMEKCKLIIRNGIGVNTIDVDACNAKGIMVGNIPTYCIEEVATHAIALMLTLNRKVFLYNRTVREGIWDVKEGMNINSTVGATLGLVGFGRIPRLINDRAQALGMNVLAYDPFVTAEAAAETGATKAEMDQIIAESDFISIHCPLTPETKGMFNYEAFKAMKDSAYLINTARGPIVNEPDLVQALEEGLIGGAGLDVLMEDKGQAEHPLYKFENCIITPHAAWYSETSILRRRTQTVDSVIEVLEGREPNSFLNKAALQS
ncbi:MAG: C-terminal binding protein [Porticoccaceae bacterium]|jgi:D-3-phosphoglycerate dehydrogenase / 2-oxoglutarate reductase|nr:C-terminal binding protein [Porticoccaceae bacterium]